MGGWWSQRVGAVFCKRCSIEMKGIRESAKWHLPPVSSGADPGESCPHERRICTIVSFYLHVSLVDWARHLVTGLPVFHVFLRPSMPINGVPHVLTQLPVATTSSPGQVPIRNSHSIIPGAYLEVRSEKLAWSDMGMKRGRGTVRMREIRRTRRTVR